MARPRSVRKVAPFLSGQPEIADRRLQQLLDYWEKARGSRLLPSRSDIDPSELRFLLGHLILLDVLREPPRFRVRLQGTEVGWWAGGDFTGRTLDQVPSPALAAVAQAHLAVCVDSAKPHHWRGELAIAEVPRRYEGLILPLAADGKSVNMLLAAVLCQDRRSSA